MPKLRLLKKFNIFGILLAICLSALCISGLNSTFANASPLQKNISIVQDIDVPEVSFTTNVEFEQILCKILCFAKNKFVRFVAVIIIIALGVGLFVGKVNWGVALATILALALIFSSDALIEGIFSTSGTGSGIGLDCNSIVDSSCKGKS